jgi:uncharacterized protein YeaO (DUF488 family)
MPAKKSLAKEHIVYHKDGTLWAKGKMARGVMTGYWEWFRKDGTKLRSGHFENGEQVGEWTTYDRDGQPYKVTHMKAKKSAAASARSKLRQGIALKRAYEAAKAGDGFRVLVDRIWPRGVSKSAARIDLWLKEIAPSTSLRKWFGHDPAKWQKFRDRYFRELDANADAVARLRDQLRRGKVTLVYGAKDEEHNQAVALQEYLASKRN